MKKYFFTLYIVFIILAEFSCNNSSYSANEKMDSATEVKKDSIVKTNNSSPTKSADPSVDSSAQSPKASMSNDSLRSSDMKKINRPRADFDIRDSSVMHFDTSLAMIVPPHLPRDAPAKDSQYNNAARRSAVLGYSFFKNIKQHETRNIIAYVSIINAISHVIDTLKDLNAGETPQRANDTATILARNIFVFKALDIQLLNAGDSDFLIKPFSERRQLIDSSDGNSWTWSVTPLTNKQHGRLIMNIIAEKSDGSRQPFNVITIPITISIDKAINRTLWQWMMDNPEKVFTIILIPFIAFFWKQIIGLFKKKDDKT